MDIRKHKLSVKVKTTKNIWTLPIEEPYKVDFSTSRFENRFDSHTWATNKQTGSKSEECVNVE